MLINRYKLIVHIVSQGKSLPFHYKIKQGFPGDLLSRLKACRIILVLMLSKRKKNLLADVKARKANSIYNCYNKGKKCQYHIQPQESQLNPTNKSEVVNYSSTTNVSHCRHRFLSVPDHLCFRFGADTELHRPRSLVCNLPPADVQEHSQAGPQEYRYNLARVLCHNDPSSCGDGEQQPATWANQQDQPVYSVWWTLGRFVPTHLPQTHQT